MYFEGIVASEISKLETPRAERRAAERWRFRHLKSKESQVLTAVVTNILQLFLR
jgi:FixJ family two-component response regulator